MSEEQCRGARDFTRYDSMTTEELEKILRLDAEAPMEQESDTELILYIMEQLQQKKVMKVMFIHLVVGTKNLVKLLAILHTMLNIQLNLIM